MKNVFHAIAIAGIALTALAGCGNGGGSSSSASSSTSAKSAALSGCYVGDLGEMGGKMELNFAGDGKAAMTMIDPGGNRISPMDCTYQAGEAQTALSCPGSSGISLSRLDGGDLEGNLGGTIVRFKKC